MQAAMYPAGKGYLLIGVRGSEFTTGMSFVHCAPPRIKHWRQNLQILDIQSLVPQGCFAKTLESVCRQNKSPSAIALGDWFPRRTYFLTSKASPNDSGIVIIVIIVIGEAKLVLHIGGIIAQTIYLNRVTFPRVWHSMADAITPIRYQWGMLMLSKCKVKQRHASFLSKAGHV
jgi:hypothetical protein